MADERIHFAYHVTKVPEHTAQPNWATLECRKAWSDYDGALLRQPCVYFTTTLFEGGLPATSVYPLDGISGQKYWRVMVPMNRFNNYDIWHCKTTMTPQGVKQVLLVMARDEDKDLMNQLKRKDREVTNDKNVVDQHLKRQHHPSGMFTYYCNEYQSSKKVVNIAVLHDFEIEGTDWDVVQKY